MVIALDLQSGSGTGPSMLHAPYPINALRSDIGILR